MGLCRSCMPAHGNPDDGRPLPSRIHPGPARRHNMSDGEELEWKKWSPKVGDMVLVDLRNDEFWPGKVSISVGVHLIPIRS